jgi:hypothetical protein
MMGAFAESHHCLSQLQHHHQLPDCCHCQCWECFAAQLWWQPWNGTLAQRQLCLLWLVSLMAVMAALLVLV